MKFVFLLTLALFVTFCTAEIFFQEEFGEGWDNRWVISTHKKAEAGNFLISAGKYFSDVEADKGLKTGKDARFYQISAEMKKDFSNEDKNLILQFSVKHEQNIDCGGAYVKILPAGIDQTDFSGDSPYNIMFGPDICGNTKRVHAIITYNGKNHLIKGTDIKAETDEWTHLYTFILKNDRTFEILVDNKPVRSGAILDNWDLLPAKQIQDPSVSKPEDWVDEKEIVDPSATKPEGWDVPQQIADTQASRPSDWDSDLDGEWEAPFIDNPDYKGEWKAPKIPNPAYKGEWVHPLIANPEYKDDPSIGKFSSNKYVGIEIWQVKAGTIFDNFLVTDDVETAKAWAEKTLKTQLGEKAAQQKEKEEKEKEEKENASPSDEETVVDEEGEEGEDEEEILTEEELAALDAEFPDSESLEDEDDDEDHDEL